MVFVPEVSGGRNTACNQAMRRVAGTLVIRAEETQIGAAPGISVVQEWSCPSAPAEVFIYGPVPAFSIPCASRCALFRKRGVRDAVAGGMVNVACPW